jgi:hypothetical protein
MTTVALSEEMSLVDNPTAPEMYADALSGYFLLNGTVRLTFECARANHVSMPGPVNRVVVGRLMMPLDAAERMARDVLAFIEQVRSEEPHQGPGGFGPPGRPQ